MKKYQVIIRMLMAAAILLGVETTASAQFGGLKKLAKKAVEKTISSDESSSTTESYNGSAVRNARGETKNPDKASENPALSAAKQRTANAENAAKSSGGIVIKHKQYGMLLGTYYPAERKFVNGRGDAIIIADDGTAKYTDGTDFGKVTDNGFSTKGIPQMTFDAATGRYTTEGIVVGEIKDEGGANIVTYNGKDWMQTSAPIDHKILAFITYGTSFSNDIIKSQIKADADYAAATAKPKTADYRSYHAADYDWLVDRAQKDPFEADDQWVFLLDRLDFNGITVARYKENILDNFYNGKEMEMPDHQGKMLLGKYTNGGMRNHQGKYLGHIDNNGNAINAAGKKVGRVEGGKLFDANGKQIGTVRGSKPIFAACFAFFMFGKK